MPVPVANGGHLARRVNKVADRSDQHTAKAVRREDSKAQGIFEGTTTPSMRTTLSCQSHMNEMLLLKPPISYCVPQTCTRTAESGAMRGLRHPLAEDYSGANALRKNVVNRSIHGILLHLYR